MKNEMDFLHYNASSHHTSKNMQTRSQTKVLALAQEQEELIQNTKNWQSVIKQQLDLVKQATKIERIMLMTKIYKLINAVIDNKDTVFINLHIRSYRNFIMTGFMKIFELRWQIQNHRCSASENELVQEALQILNTVEGKLRVLLKKIKNIRELAVSRGYCPDKVEGLIARKNKYAK